MARIFITGSADGLGQLTATALIEKGHKVVLHARTAQRVKDALKKNPRAENGLSGNLAVMNETIQLAHEINKLGQFDAIIHNAGVYDHSSEEMLAVNVLAPYLLTSLIQKPKRLIYLSSGMHLYGHFDLNHFRSGGNHTYSDSKQYVTMLAKAVARKWKDVYSNAVNPGWVPTKMGGSSAPDNLQQGYETQVWLAVGNDEAAKVSGHYFFHRHPAHHHPLADDVQTQDKLLQACEEVTGVAFPEKQIQLK